MKFRMILTASLLLAGIAIPSVPQTKSFVRTAVVPKSVKESSPLNASMAGGTLKGTIFVRPIRNEELAKVFTCRDITVAVGRVIPQTTGQITLDTFQMAASTRATGDIKSGRCRYSISNIFPVNQRLTIDTRVTGSNDFNCTTLEIANNDTSGIVLYNSRVRIKDFIVRLVCHNIG